MEERRNTVGFLTVNVVQFVSLLCKKKKSAVIVIGQSHYESSQFVRGGFKMFFFCTEMIDSALKCGKESEFEEASIRRKKMKVKIQITSSIRNCSGIWTPGGAV